MAGAGEPDGAAVCAGANDPAREANPKNDETHPGCRGGGESGLAGDAEREPGGEVVRRGGDRGEPVQGSGAEAEAVESEICRAAGDCIAGDRDFRGSYDRRAADVRADADRARGDDDGTVHELRDRAADAV